MATSGNRTRISPVISKWLRLFEFSSDADSLRARFQQGISWNVAGAILNNGVNFLTNIAIANLLGREIFGEYGMIQSTLTTFVGIAQAAGGITATKYVAEFRSSDKEKAGRVLGLCTATTAATGVIGTLLILFCAPWLASTTLKASFLARPLQIAGAVVLFTVMNAYQMGALAGLESYREWAIVNGLQGPVQLGICSFSAWRWGLQGAVTGLLATSAIRWLVLHFALVREAKRQGIVFRYSGIWQERSILLKFALPAAISGLSAPPAMWLGNTFLVRQASGYSQMALFSAALNLKNVVMFLPVLLNSVGFSLLNNHRAGESGSQYRTVFWVTVCSVAATALAGAAFVGVFGRLILRLYGKNFPEAYPALLVLLCCAVLESIAMAVYLIIGAEEKMWLSLLIVMLPRDIAIVLFAYWLTPLHGALGLSFAHLSAWAICSAVIFTVVARIGLTPRTQRQSDPIGLAGLLEGEGEF
jgi:O-antigen/teichoic acid export membrane protein